MGVLWSEEDDEGDDDEDDGELDDRLREKRRDSIPPLLSIGGDEALSPVLFVYAVVLGVRVDVDGVLMKGLALRVVTLLTVF